LSVENIGKMPRSENSRNSPVSHRKHRDHPKSYALPDNKKESEKVVIENGKKHKRRERKRKRSSEIGYHNSLPIVGGNKEFSPAESGEMRDSDILEDLKDQDLNEIEKKVAETRKRNIDPKAEEERLIRQKWAEEKRIKEEVTRRYEIYIQKQVNNLLVEKNLEVQQIVQERVLKERERIEREREEAEQIRKEIEKRERIRKMVKTEEEEAKQREELQRLEHERLKRLNEAKKREEDEKAKRLADELRLLEDKQRREAEEKRKQKREQELILNKNKSRAKLSFTLKK